MEIQERENDIEIDLKVIVSVLIKKIWLIVLVGFLFALLTTTGIKFFVTPAYQSTTKMYVLTKQSQDMLTSSDLQASTLFTQDYMQLIKSRTVVESAITRLNLDMAYEEMLSKLSVSTADDTRIITISVIDEDPYRARDIADTIRDISADQIKSVMNSEAVNVVDKANIPDVKYAPNTTKYGMFAGAVGCLIVIAVVLIQCMLDDTIKTPEDVEQYLNLSTLVVIPLSDDEKKSQKRFAGKMKKWRNRQ